VWYTPPEKVWREKRRVAGELAKALERQRYGPDHQYKPEQSYEKSHDVAPACGAVIVRLG
jgi:hypothetical protein